MIRRRVLGSEAGNPRSNSRGDNPVLLVSAFTIIEVTISLTLLLILGGPFMTMAVTSMRATAENDSINKVNQENRKAIFRLERELRRAMATGITVGNSGHSVTFTPPGGFDGTAVIPGAQVRFLLRSRADDALNGADDSGNGIVDEGELVRIDVATGAEVIIGSSFDLASSGFVIAGSALSISLTTLANIDRRFGTFSVTGAVSIVPRN